MPTFVSMPPLRVPFRIPLLAVGVLSGAAATLIGILLLRGRAAPIDLAAPTPRMTFLVSNAQPTAFYALFRTGNQLRVVTATTPATFQVAETAIIAQFKPRDGMASLQLSVVGPGGHSHEAGTNPHQPFVPLTFVSTRGWVPLPWILGSGIVYEPWGGRPHYSSLWSRWPSQFLVDEAELAALPPPEPWPPHATSAGKIP
ncbi:MAG: hypothetical protein IT580_20740 [Verrucomicrobiales bacterium]|nr:hypothetical protein [Verrucomicrobiales bacterium]